MPIEVGQLQINGEFIDGQSTVEPMANDGANPDQLAEGVSKSEILEECRLMVLELLRERNER